MKIKTSQLTGAALDWAVAKAEGRVLSEPPPATDDDLAKLLPPFKLYDIQYVAEGKQSRWEVKEVTVVQFGIDHACGATAPSVTFKQSDGRIARGSASLFYLTREDAQTSADWENIGGVEDFWPSTDWSQGGPIIEREGIRLHRSHTGAWWAASEATPGAPISGPTPLIAAMRCVVDSTLGDEVDIPEGLCSTP